MQPMDPLRAIVESQPPTTDALSWLVIVEVNLSAKLLPDFNDLLLKDTELTSSVGWDLIPLLLRFPNSQECLRTIGRYGNPRECIINVCEQLRKLDFESTKGEDSESNLADGIAEEDSSQATSQPAAEEPESLKIGKLKIAKPTDSETVSETSVESNRLISLIRLLVALHPRIRTKHPSRFLSTSLSALLSTYSDAIHFAPAQELTLEIVRFIKIISGVKRPHLPQRYSSQHQVSKADEAAGSDPEATTEDVAPEEKALTARLLTSFVTHVLEDYVNALPELGMSWSARLNEMLNPNKTVPGKSVITRFRDQEILQERDSISGQLVALARDLALDDDELLKTLTQPVLEVERADDGPPSSPSDIPLSEAGSLFLLGCRTASSILFESSLPLPPIFIFPDHAAISFKFIGQAEFGGPESIGTEPEGVIDAILAIGLYLAKSGKIGDPVYEGDEKFYQYLQSLSLISANCPNPSLRYQAHTLTSLVLHSHPEDVVRLSFIKDTLEHCPYDNLKESAVEWLKAETLSANSTLTTEDNPETSIFATPVALDSIAPFLFPDLDQYRDLTDPEQILQNWTHFKANFAFHIATLNFYYLLLRSKDLKEALNITTLVETYSIESDFISMLEKASKLFNRSMTDVLIKEEGERGLEQAAFDLYVLDQALERARNAHSA